MKKITEKLLKEMVDAIVREVAPERIILFGSRARGDLGKNSDIDLLIVERESFSRKRSRWKELSQLWDTVARFRVPIDLLLYSEEEFEKWRDIKEHVINTALREGKLLYERN